MAKHETVTLVDEKVAISLFLDSLLREPEPELKTETAAVIPEVKKETATVTTLKVEPVVEAKEKIQIKVEQETALQVEVKVEQETILQTDENIEVKFVENTADKHQEAVELRKPEERTKPFQVLMFDVAGLNLAVPLAELNGVINWREDSVTEMPGHADFYMGILQYLDHKIAVIDTAKMVFPVNKQKELINDDPRERVKHIVLIGEYGWGLACDKIGEVITLSPKDVKWRKDNSKRKWLAGTVIDHMCALLNCDSFAEMLGNGDKA